MTLNHKIKEKDVFKIINKEIYRGDIFIANLSSCIGSEQYGIRPVLIIQNNTGNKFSPTVIIASVTSRYNAKFKLPTPRYTFSWIGVRTWLYGSFGAN